MRFRAVAVGVTRGLVLVAIAMVAQPGLLEPSRRSRWARVRHRARWRSGGCRCARAAGGDRLAPLAALGMGLVVVVAGRPELDRAAAPGRLAGARP